MKAYSEKMIKIITIIGARPQIIKASALSRCISEKYNDIIEEIIIHTGQHYDFNMSEVFFSEMGMPMPTFNLEIQSSFHGEQTAAMIEGIEKILLQQKPQAVVLYGDTNSTLAGSLAAVKLHTPIIHVESGLRSFNKKMPEEINRIVCDHSSTLLFTPTQTGYNNLIREGFNIENQPPFTNDNPKVYLCGDVMYDNTLHFTKKAETCSTILSDNQLKANEYLLVTIHRDSNTDNTQRLNSIISAILKISEKYQQSVVLPLHPRTRKMMPLNLDKELYEKLTNNNKVIIIPPISFTDMMVLEKNASIILTDSGGVQKESYFMQKPCIVLRSETEWKELVEAEIAIVADADENKIIDSFEKLYHSKKLKFPPLFGDGKAAEFIAEKIIENFK